jgi:hypothetical protein
MSGAHKVALALHGLNRKDRNWLLEQLPASHRSAVSTLVSEVDDFTHRPNVHLFEQVMLEQSLQTQASVATTDTQRLEHCDAHAIFGALQAEPDWVAATMLHGRPAWGQALLALFGTERRARITKLVAHAAATPATMESLASGLLAQIMLRGDVSPTAFDKRPAKPAPWLQRLKGIGKWRR